MKNLLTILLILSSLNFYSQSEDSNETQKAWARVSEIKLLNTELSSAYIGFYQAYEANPDTELGKVCLQKSDSLKVVLGEIKFNEIIGTWKLKESYSNWGSIQETDFDKTEKLVIISSDSLISVEKDKVTGQSLSIKKEHIRFKSFGGLRTPSWSVYKSEKQIWNYTIKNNGDILHLSKTGELEDNGGRSFIACGVPNLIYEKVK